jgi:hypothetical protein
VLISHLLAMKAAFRRARLLEDEFAQAQHHGQSDQKYHHHDPEKNLHAQAFAARCEKTQLSAATLEKA